MRPSLVAPVLLLVLSGCASPPDEAEAPAALDPDAPFVPPSQQQEGMMPRLRFDADEFEQTANYAGAFPTSSTCTPFTPCAAQEERIDVTAQVPAGAPVDLTAIVTATDSVYVLLEVEDAAIQRYNSHWGSDRAELAATLVRKESGTVTLVVQHGNLFAIDPTTTEVPFDAEVRTAVRPDVLPSHLPVFVALAPGDRIEAMGADADDIDDLMVIPPGMDPVHQMDNLTFVVAPDMPAGDYVVMVAGAQAMLHGPNVTMSPAPIQVLVGEDRPVTSGETLTWTTPIPGIPAYAGVLLVMGESGGLDNTRVSYRSAYTMAIRQGGIDLATEASGECFTPCFDMNGPGGQATDGVYTDFFQEGLRLGELEFEITNDVSQGLHAYEVIGYIEPRE
jgi:hypothetical protein